VWEKNRFDPSPVTQDTSFSKSQWYTLLFPNNLIFHCLIQYLSCNQIQWWLQLQRVAIAPVPIILLWLFLYIAPGMRWPIEGLVQSGSPALRKGLSSGFYAFWIGLYIQNMFNGVAQLCPV
jgi:hypothetical protein